MTKTFITVISKSQSLEKKIHNSKSKKINTATGQGRNERKKEPREKVEGGLWTGGWTTASVIWWTAGGGRTSTLLGFLCSLLRDESGAP